MANFPLGAALRCLAGNETEFLTAYYSGLCGNWAAVKLQQCFFCVERWPELEPVILVRSL